MARQDIWYFVDEQGRLIQRTENDGYAFLRNGPCAKDRQVAPDELNEQELKKALRAVLAILQSERKTKEVRQ